MSQFLHGSARTTQAVRRAIQHSEERHGSLKWGKRSGTGVGRKRGDRSPLIERLDLHPLFNTPLIRAGHERCSSLKLWRARQDSNLRPQA